MNRLYQNKKDYYTELALHCSNAPRAYVNKPQEPADNTIRAYLAHYKMIQDPLTPENESNMTQADI
ncbi:hypothetical protein COT72_01495 [archaeon CG10_big_fil_rev_8_21_14_0_10_43_11]|nr:MAG: hypothetical protein COT72_01495 [archaeon CG10_big_fil_rev_8_21_14_0_10_43_11]